MINTEKKYFIFRHFAFTLLIITSFSISPTFAQSSFHTKNTQHKETTRITAFSENQNSTIDPLLGGSNIYPTYERFLEGRFDSNTETTTSARHHNLPPQEGQLSPLLGAPQSFDEEFIPAMDNQHETDQIKESTENYLSDTSTSKPYSDSPPASKRVIARAKVLDPQSTINLQRSPINTEKPIYQQPW